LEKLELVKKLVIFDLDGTLVDSTDQIWNAVYSTREKLHYTQELKENLVPKIGLAARELFADLNLTDLEVTRAVETLRKEISDIKLTELNLYPSVQELLNLLISRNFLLAIGTNKPFWLADKALKECNIRGNFTLVAGSDSLPLKPDKAILEYCINHLSIPSNSTIMIGDRVEDMHAASSARVISYGVLQGVHNRNQLLEAGAKKVFFDITDLYESLVQGWDFDDL
jgi:phosphoglycolate phosphatase